MLCLCYNKWSTLIHYYFLKPQFTLRYNLCIVLFNCFWQIHNVMYPSLQYHTAQFNPKNSPITTYSPLPSSPWTLKSTDVITLLVAHRVISLTVDHPLLSREPVGAVLLPREAGASHWHPRELGGCCAASVGARRDLRQFCRGREGAAPLGEVGGSFAASRGEREPLLPPSGLGGRPIGAPCISRWPVAHTAPPLTVHSPTFCLLPNVI